MCLLQLLRKAIVTWSVHAVSWNCSTKTLSHLSILVLFLEGFFANTVNGHWSINFIYSLFLFVCFFPCLSFASLPKNLFLLSTASTPTDVWVSVVILHESTNKENSIFTSLIGNGAATLRTTQRSSRFQASVTSFLSCFKSLYWSVPGPGETHDFPLCSQPLYRLS